MAKEILGSARLFIIEEFDLILTSLFDRPALEKIGILYLECPTLGRGLGLNLHCYRDLNSLNKTVYGHPATMSR